MSLRLLAGFALATLTIVGCDSTTVVAPTADADVEAALATVVNVVRSARMNAAIEQAALNPGLEGDEASKVKLEANEDTFNALFAPEDQEQVLEATRVLNEAYPEMLTMTEEENTAFVLELLTRQPDAVPNARASLMLDECTNWCDATAAAQTVAAGTVFTVAVATCAFCVPGALAILSTTMTAIAVSNAGCVAGCNRNS